MEILVVFACVLALVVIDVPIGPVPHPRIGTVQAACEGGRPSHSVAAVLEHRHDQTLFSVEITTGRPHQIRIHLASAGHPLIGDSVYDAGGGIKQDPGLPGDGGYSLHAERLHGVLTRHAMMMPRIASQPLLSSCVRPGKHKHENTSIDFCDSIFCIGCSARECALGDSIRPRHP